MFKPRLTGAATVPFLPRMGAKDWLVEKAAVVMINQAFLKPYGVMTRLKLDSAARCLEAEVQLNGEAEPVLVQIHEYEIIEEQGHAHVILKRMTTSRAWLTRLAEDFAVGRRFELPESVRKFLPMLR